MILLIALNMISCRKKKTKSFEYLVHRNKELIAGTVLYHFSPKWHLPHILKANHNVARRNTYKNLNSHNHQKNQLDIFHVMFLPLPYLGWAEKAPSPFSPRLNTLVQLPNTRSSTCILLSGWIPIHPNCPHLPYQWD